MQKPPARARHAKARACRSDRDRGGSSVVWLHKVCQEAGSRRPEAPSAPPSPQCRAVLQDQPDRSQKEVEWVERPRQFQEAQIPEGDAYGQSPEKEEAVLHTLPHAAV